MDVKNGLPTFQCSAITSNGFTFSPSPLWGGVRGGGTMANEIARRLRRNLTIDEAKLWAELRLLREHGAHFRRQAPIGKYIVDFACFTRRLVIEVDGIQHDTSKGKSIDAVRDAFLASHSFKVLRYTNGEVTDTLEGVMMEVLAELGLLKRPSDPRSKAPHP